MKRMCAEHTVAVMVGWVTAEMISSLLVGCASSPKSPIVADASPERTADASEAENFCTGPATGALIDDMSASSISLTPPSCGTKGTWYAISTGTLTIPTVDPSIASNCGSDCQSLYSPLPAGFPGATGDAGVAPGVQAMCVAGKTGTSQYDGAGMQLVLAGTGSVPALIDASDYGGIEFWLWVSPDTAASVSSSLLVGIFDRNQTPGGGVCDVNSSGANACGYAAAAVSSSMAQNHGSGRLFADDGSKLTALSGGWQHVWAPWSSFTTNTYWGGANEAKVDPRTLGAVELWVEQDNTSGPAVPFDFCVYELSFLPKSDLPALDGGAEDGGETVTFCTGPATEALIDDMSGSSISLTPPSCGTKGTWHAISDGTLTIPTVDPSIASNCGSDCQSLYSPLPAGFSGATGDAGVAPGAQAMCVAGTTGTSQYGGAGMQLVLAWSSAVPDGGAYATDAGTMVPAPALIDASDYGGIQFLLWVSPDTAAAVASSFEVALVDKNQLRGGGKCDPTDTTSIHACAGATAGVSFSVAAASEGTGPLFGADGSELSTLVGGWQLVRAPWSSFLANPYYGGANESVVDPKTLAFADFVVAQDRPSGPAIPFDFCIYGLTFYR
ncbi:MAG TPA: hypothetical protein VJ860_22120 [Polyangia bacterium]|nr:hypothetical protein [Polyangia bacterium]